MPAGIKYDLKGQEVEKELYNVKSGYRLAGGFNIDDSDIDDGQYIPVLAPLALDFKTRTAKVSKSVKAVEAINATTLKVQKGSFAKVNMHLGNVLFEAKTANGKEVKNPANFLNYARVKKEAGATITALGQAYEIQTNKLYVPVSDKDKETLGARFMFI